MKILAKFNRLLLVLRTYVAVRNLPDIPTTFLGEYRITGLVRKKLGEAMKLFVDINDGKNYDFFLLLLYYLCGKKVAFCVEDKKGCIVGLELYYVNIRDKKEHTIHQAFRGIRQEIRGKGLGSALTQTALDYFSCSEFLGVSSRVSLNNKASLNSNLKLGFEPVEEYIDENYINDGEGRRYYLVRPLVPKM